MKQKTKEVIWVVALLIISCLIWNIFTNNSAIQDSTVAINIADTYFVIEKVYLLFIIVPAVFYFIYLIRILSFKFRNLIANNVFLVFNFLLLVIMFYILQAVSTLATNTVSTINSSQTAASLMSPGTQYYNLLCVGIVTSVCLIFTLLFVTIKALSIVKKNTD